MEVHSCSSFNPSPSEAMRIETRKKKILLYVPTPNTSESVKNGTTINKSILNSYGKCITEIIIQSITIQSHENWNAEENK